jgi:hypothetical protein
MPLFALESIRSRTEEETVGSEDPEEEESGTEEEEEEISGEEAEETGAVTEEEGMREEGVPTEEEVGASPVRQARRSQLARRHRRQEIICFFMVHLSSPKTEETSASYGCP